MDYTEAKELVAQFGSDWINHLPKKEKEPTFNYSGHGWEGENYKNYTNLKDVAKIIRDKLKKDYPESKFSIVTEYYSMGQSLHISLMSGPFEAILGEQTEEYENGQYNKKMIPKKENYAQLNHYQIINKEYEDGLSNGTFLTMQAWYRMRTAYKYASSYNFDDSEPQTDYFHTNFYIHLNIGKWNQPFVNTKKA
ncbi:MAG: hypothetical protein RLY43_139 [Bacteroidota bacterium]|jgi:hypothetical protein